MVLHNHIITPYVILVVLVMHIAVVGTGNVGRTIAYTLLYEGLCDELSLVDIKPGLADALADELKHAAAGLRRDVRIYAYERDEDLHSADLIIVSAGFPRPPGVEMSRRDLFRKNAEIIKYIAEVVPPNNPGARYVIVTNPVDAMATLFRRISKASFVISTGTHLETLRFRARLAEVLNVPVSKVDGFVGGEHGEEAIILWSTVRVFGIPINEYVKTYCLSLDKDSIESYVRRISVKIINALGATRFGPAVAFRDIVKAIVNNLDTVLSIAIPLKFNDIPEEVMVSVPTKVGMDLGPTLYKYLNQEEREGIVRAAKAIYKTYVGSLKYLGLY